MSENVSSTSYRASHQAPGHGRRYDELLFSEGAYDAAVWEIERQVLSDLLARHFPNGIPNALDFACGTGRVSAFMAPFCRHIVGVDISEEMLSEARKKLPKVKFICGDLTQRQDLLADCAPFDCVTAFRFFLNAEPVLRSEALAAVKSVLKPGGLLICNNHGNSTSLLTPTRWLRRRLGKPLLSSTLPFGPFARLLAEHGFELVDTHGICFLPRGLFRYMPRSCWRAVERFLAKLRIFNRFAIYQIYVARRVS